MILILDNYDSFTYNLYQYVTCLGYPAEVIRNDVVTVAQIEKSDYEAIILSPGPGTPADAGITKEAVRCLAGKKPIFGVCLGLQAIAEAFEGRVVRAPLPVHGKVSTIYHDGKSIYAGLEQPIAAGRYHSLMIERESLPGCLAISAETGDGLIMSLRHREFAIEGVQFHPESVLTPRGSVIIANFLASLRKVQEDV